MLLGRLARFLPKQGSVVLLGGFDVAFPGGPSPLALKAATKVSFWRRRVLLNTEDDEE
jgi:hypothetical protein